jgi:hypothetical protein
MWCDVWCMLEGPAGDLASRNPHTGFDATVHGRDAVRNAVQVVVESQSGEIVVLPPHGDIPYGKEGGFNRLIQGLPQAGETYTFTALNADGTPVPGTVCSDTYIGGYEPDPPTNVQAEVVVDGILVTWDPSPIIPGAFDPGGSPPLGSYSICLKQEGGDALYCWNQAGKPLPETSYRIPFRRQDFSQQGYPGHGDAGMALEEMNDGVYYLKIETFSDEPGKRDGAQVECIAYDPAQYVWFVIEGGQVRIERP